MDILFGFGAIAIYFLPWIIAAFRKHNNRQSIALTNLFFGWTMLGWLVALIWSASDNVTKTSEAK